MRMSKQGSQATHEVSSGVSTGTYASEKAEKSTPSSALA